MDDLFEWLQKIYAEDFCDGSWEHQYGMTLDTLDNPGWDFCFDLNDTDIENIPMDEVFIENSKQDWYHCKMENGKFHGWGGAKNLTDIIMTFKAWYNSAIKIVEKETEQ